MRCVGWGMVGPGPGSLDGEQPAGRQAGPDNSQTPAREMLSCPLLLGAGSRHQVQVWGLVPARPHIPLHPKQRLPQPAPRAAAVCSHSLGPCRCRRRRRGSSLLRVTSTAAPPSLVLSIHLAARAPGRVTPVSTNPSKEWANRSLPLHPCTLLLLPECLTMQRARVLLTCTPHRHDTAASRKYGAIL